MKKVGKAVLVFVLFLGGLGLTGCNEQQMARSMGGTTTIELPQGKKLINVTWKESELWYLVRDRRQGEAPERWEFKEDSVAGVWEGTVIFVEK